MIKHWGKVDTEMLIAAIVLLAVVFYFFELTASLMMSAVTFPISVIVLLGIMEYAAHELRRK
ncbi:hypothetical protein [Lactiplantibacillus fabifermentans]|uniref:Uncharacterized protein n=2 Tax=Lactiplantibacillus fabifermentans TaxID=483011 RepID=A0A0R2NFX9_9LACO|nr:hypothetical protein [Lactiplantibacillus fabifermentans]ETY75471.1 hypothetical protein LFAB_01670 [Lactiplantibacillus fabifermentans T30PCM01]KRO24696.1 hypothetical protein DY78_GL001621 [Lactiplantibacillus fabifermentans DSM 21115]